MRMRIRNVSRILRMRVFSCKMPDNKRIQGPEESTNPSVFLDPSENLGTPEPLDEKGRRSDGRKPDEIRPIYMKTGLNPRATGSAYIEHGATKVTCAVYGPKEVPRKEDTLLQGRLTCEFKFATFSCQRRKGHQQDQDEKECSNLVVQALSRAVQLKTFPKLQLEINILVVEDGGNTLGAALLCASMALATCGVKMLDVPLASSVVLCDESQCLVDPSLNEERWSEREGASGGTVTVVYLSSLDEITAMKQSGCMLPSDLMKGVDACIESCMRLKERMKSVLCSTA